MSISENTSLNEYYVWIITLMRLIQLDGYKGHFSTIFILILNNSMITKHNISLFRSINCDILIITKKKIIFDETKTFG